MVPRQAPVAVLLPLLPTPRRPVRQRRAVEPEAVPCLVVLVRREDRQEEEVDPGITGLPTFRMLRVGSAAQPQHWRFKVDNGP